MTNSASLKFSLGCICCFSGILQRWPGIKQHKFLNKFWFERWDLRKATQMPFEIQSFILLLTKSFLAFSFLTPLTFLFTNMLSWVCNVYCIVIQNNKVSIWSAMLTIAGMCFTCIFLFWEIDAWSHRRTVRKDGKCSHTCSAHAKCLSRKMSLTRGKPS